MRIEQLRGGAVEAWHDVHVAVVDGAGKLVAHVGDPDLVTYWRSAAKPFQALPLAADGVLERFAITTEQLALCCASHSSEPQHLAIVRDLLAKIGCSERDLLCGPHHPLSESVAWVAMVCVVAIWPWPTRDWRSPLHRSSAFRLPRSALSRPWSGIRSSSPVKAAPAPT